jgi:hypothetical protein
MIVTFVWTCLLFVSCSNEPQGHENDVNWTENSFRNAVDRFPRFLFTFKVKVLSKRKGFVFKRDHLQKTFLELKLGKPLK